MWVVLYVAVKKVIGLQFLRFLVSWVWGERYAEPSESQLGAVSGDSTISDNSSNSFSCPLERTYPEIRYFVYARGRPFMWLIQCKL